MELVGVEEILPQTANSAATFSVDFVLRGGAAGAEVHVTTSDRQSSASITIALSALLPDGSAVQKIVSAAVTSDTTTTVSVMPGLAASANARANDVLPGKARLTITFSAGTYDLRAYALYYR